MVTMKDVAKAAGVSVATVSNYLNNTKSVSCHRRQRIADAIDKLNYIPNQLASTLKSGMSKNVGILLPNIQDNYYVQVFHGIESIFNEKGYNLNLGITHDLVEIEQRYIYDFLKAKVAGLIVFTSQPDNHDFFLNNIIEKNIPFVHIDRRIPISKTCFLTFDNESTIENLTSFFLVKGKSNIALFAGPPKFSCEKAAVNGYRKAFDKRNIPVSDNNIIHTTLAKEASFRSTVMYLRDNNPDVVITTSKLVTLGVLEGLGVAGQRDPRDVTVVTLGEDNWNRFDTPSNVITIAKKAILLGCKAAESLWSQINNQEKIRHRNWIFKDSFNAAAALTAPRAYIKKEYDYDLNVMMLDTLQVELFIGLVPSFNNNYGAKVRIERVPHQQLLEQILRDDGSTDVYMFDMPWLYFLAKEKILEDITPFIASGGFQKGIYLKNCLDLFGLFNGRYYGLPFMYAPQILFYRKDLFRDKALSNEYYRRYKVRLQPPRTWKEFNTIACFFTSHLNPISPTPYGTAVSAAYDECLVPEVYMRMQAYGSKIYDGNFRVVFNNPQTVKAYMNFMELIHSATPSPLAFNDMTVVDEFLNGNVAMLVTYPPFISDINNLQRYCQIDHVGFSEVPGRSPILGGWSLGISRRSKNKNEAFCFINWACGEELANYSTIMTGQSAIARVFDNNELNSLYPWLPLYRDVYDSAEPIIPPHKGGGKLIPQHMIDKIVSRWLYELIKEEVTVNDAIYYTGAEITELFTSFGF